MSQMSDYRENSLIQGLYRTTNILTRANTTAYNVGDVMRLSTYDGNFYECISSGTSAGAPPSFNTNLGDTTTDGSVTWLTLKPGVMKRPKYLALYTAAPGETGGGTEVSGGSYARVAVPPADANWAAPAGGNGVTSNVNAATFPAPTANWGVITHMAEVDRASAGNIEMYGPLTTPKTINNGDAAPSFASSAYSVTFA